VRKQSLLGQNFVESWTYSACLNIVETCERYLVTDKPVTSFVAVKAELLELAKKQVRILFPYLRRSPIDD
jgi:hypothetical protein